MIPTNNNNCVSWSRQLARPVILLYLLISLIAPAPVDARECYWYTDSLGRRRRRCRGLIPGIIAALVVGFLVIMAFLSLAFVLRRRQRRATLEAGGVLPPSGSNPQVNMAQPPAYPPPSYPSIPPPDMHPPPNLPPPAAYHELEKNEHAVYHHDPTTLQPPPAANLASHHASH
ncbi:hypothetical protein PCANC_14483 [Puccinia coronata f. sp. avenae]|uniref:Uncharacterized protein n=1 Tax=Puccinia coronata f. sp. avenae TaxID=200324 RepID=A0A2N5V7N8_9BASI|nr:hypothetical protein PCANC_14483 [Puccinia coronata f. sp. avenae]PLW14768.1 hypothetical protein PCASD_19551 [Puccinia coronata f. sp. avenae]PLW46010.1 hypothetical protein PCASD_03474 [Puccinia coronata f. sp. avenae]